MLRILYRRLQPIFRRLHRGPDRACNRLRKVKGRPEELSATAPPRGDDKQSSGVTCPGLDLIRAFVKWSTKETPTFGNRRSAKQSRHRLVRWQLDHPRTPSARPSNRTPRDPSAQPVGSFPENPCFLVSCHTPAFNPVSPCVRHVPQRIF